MMNLTILLTIFCFISFVTAQKGKGSANYGLLPTPGGGKCGLQSEINSNFNFISEFPWLALLQYDIGRGKRSFGCGGALISERYVLTAAHCLDESLPAGYSLISVRLGEWDTSTLQDCDDSYIEEDICNDPPVDIPISEKIAHPNYNPKSKNKYNDIALLRLKNAAKYSEFILPICLPSDPNLRQNDHANEVMTVAGWGRTEYGQKSSKKLKIGLEGKDLGTCTNIYKNLGISLNSSQMCAGGVEGEDSCQGDSGGPLMTQTGGRTPYWYIVGLVSFGPKQCGTQGFPGIYTNVAKYIDWINSNVKP